MKFIRRYCNCAPFALIPPDIFYLSESKVYFSKNFEDGSLVYSATDRVLNLFKLNDRYSIIENNTDAQLYLINNANKEITKTNYSNFKRISKQTENLSVIKLEDKIGLLTNDDILNPVWTKQIDDFLFSFGDDQYLLYTEFNNRYKITCLSASDGHELWSRDFTGDYWKLNAGEKVNQKILSWNVGLSDGKVILHFTPGLLALDVKTGTTIWDDVIQKFYVENTFKLYKDKIYQFIGEFQEDIQRTNFYLRVVDIDTGKNLHLIKVKDNVTDFDRLNYSPLSDINARYSVTEKFIIFSDREYIYVIDRLTFVLLDCIKVPFEKKNFHAGAFDFPEYDDGYLIYPTYGNKDRVDILVFKLEDDMI